MSVVQVLRESRKSRDNYFTIEKYNLNDLSTSHTIKFLIEHLDTVKNYFCTKNINNLENQDDYYDYLFLKFIIKFEDDANFIPDEFAIPLIDLVSWANSKIGTFSNGQTIKCIKDNYKKIFQLANNFHDMGLMNETIKLIIQFYAGVKDFGIFEYLIEEHTYYVFDHFEDFYDILKKNNQLLLRLLIVSNISKIIIIRFNQICELIRGIYQRGFQDIASESGQIVFKAIEERYQKKEDEYLLQSDLKAAYDMLYQIKADEARLVITWMKDVNERVSKRIMETGKEFSCEIPIKPYSDWMDNNKEVFPLNRYLTITHETDKENLWTSKIENINDAFQPSIVDFIASSKGTNSYFTISRLNAFDIHASTYSVCLTYWFSSTDLENEYRESLKLVIESIFEMLNHDITFDNISDDIDCFIQTLAEAIKEHKHGISVFSKTMYSMAFLEKIMRLIYTAIDKNIFFEKNVTLGTILRTYENSNMIMTKILGEQHLRWTRYYLLKDDNEVGLEYRNRMAHLREINPKSFSLFEYLKIVFIVISTINTVFVNLINKEDLMEYRMQIE